MKTPVGILGATGMVGQHFIKFLADHPWFEVTWVGASDRSAGKLYKDATQWRLDGVMPTGVAGLTVDECKPTSTETAGHGGRRPLPAGPAPKLMFSATDASVATEIEQAFAKAGHIVVSNSKNHRMDADVPLLVPEINGDHLRLLALQRKNRGWKGAIATNPNCSTVALTMALGPLKKFGIKRVICTTMQAVSGAGYPGVPSMDILCNVVPYIGGEEEKMQVETQKILGDYKKGAVIPLDARVSASCNRVPSIDGHIISVSVELEKKVTREKILAAIATYKGIPQEKNLPSAPAQPVQYMESPDRPQPRRDAGRENGMACFVGRLRECPVLDWKFTCLAHNTIRGAAGAAVLNAELMKVEGLLD